MNQRILIVDDLDTNRFLLEEALADLAAEVHSVSSGGEALIDLERMPPDLVLLDFQMPGMDGIETSRRIKDRVGDRYTYVLLLSGYHEAGEHQSLEQSKADRFLGKPYSLAALREAVREGLSVVAGRRTLV